MSRKKLAIIIISAITVLTGAYFVLGGYGQSGPDAAPNLDEYGLVGYWSFEEGSGQTVYDKSGNGNNGTLGASSSVGKDDPVFASGHDSNGPGGMGLQFDGVDDYVGLPTLDSFNSLTITAWIYPQDTATAHEIVSGGSSYYEIFVQSGKLDAWVASTSANEISGVTANKWHYVTLTYDGSYIILYLDGVAGTPQSKTGTIGVATPHIGARGSSLFFNGTIDSVRIYNRALSIDEIRMHYNQKKPILHLKMDEGSGTTAYDESFNGNDGTLVNTPSWVQGKFGSALDFESGSSQYGYSADSASTSITGDLTISTWIKPESTTAATLFDITGKWDGANESYLLSQYGDEIRMYIDSASNYKTTDSANLLTNQWYHLEAVYDASAQTVDIYINGILQKGTVTGTIPASIGDDTGRFHIGTEDSTTTAANFYDGLIDDVRIYNYARTQDEILSDYNAGKAAHLGKNNQRDDGLVGYWNFEEGSGQTVYDKSGNGNNGTLGASSSVGKDDPVFASGHDSNGPGGMGLQFDGNDDYVKIGNDSSVDLTNEFTLEAWVKPDSATQDDWAAILGRTTSTNPYPGYNLSINGANPKKYRFWFAHSGGMQYLYSTSDLTTNWTHIVGVYDNGNAYFYINGILENSGSGYTDLPSLSTSEILSIGNSDGNSLDGTIDSVRIYKRALSADEIRMHYNQKKPILHLKMDEGSGTTAYDESFNDNDAILGGDGAGTDLPTWTQGKFGSALDFDGSDDYISVSDDTVLKPTNTISVESWIKFDSLTSTVSGGAPAGTQYFIFKKNSQAACFTDYTLFKYSNENVFRFGVDKEGSPDCTGAVQTNAVGTTTIQTDIWYYVVGTFDGQDIKLYVNGKLESTANHPYNLYHSTDPLYIGQTGQGWNGFFNGKMDDVRIYNYARTQDEILTDYNTGKAIHLGKNNQRNDGLVGYWNFEEGSGQTVYDRSGNGNNGTLGTSTSVGKDDPVFASGYDSNGPGGMGLQFDGVDDYVDVGSGDSITNFSTEMTVCAWVKVTTFKSTYTDGLIGVYGSNTGYALRLGSLATRFMIGNGVGYVTVSAAAVDVGEWKFICGRKTTSDKVTIFIDGVQKNEQDSGGDIVQRVANIHIGHVSYSSYFNGIIDSVRIYNRALSADEIRMHYNQKKPVLHLKMDEGSGTTAYDESFNDNDGTIYGTYGTAESGTASTLTDTDKSWTTDEWKDETIEITSGTGSGQTRTVSSNTADTITVTSNWTTTPDSTSVYRITSKDEWTTGKYGSAIDFDYTDDYIEVTDFPFISPPFTLSAWVKNDRSDNPYNNIISKGGVFANDTNFAFGYRRSATSANLYLHWRNGSILYGKEMSMGISPETGEWHFVTGVIGSNYDLELFVDGVSIGTDSGNSIPTNGSHPLRIGGHDGSGNDRNWDGLIDDVRIYNYARTQDEILTDYNNGLAVHLR